jgi:hypothetical protein
VLSVSEAQVTKQSPIHYMRLLRRPLSICPFPEKHRDLRRTTQPARLAMTKRLAPRCGRHQNDLVLFLQGCIQPVQVTHMRAIDENIEVSAQVTFRVEQMKLDCRVLLDDFFDQFTDRRSRDKKLGLVVYVILHYRRKADDCHKYYFTLKPLPFLPGIPIIKSTRRSLWQNIK